MASEDYSWLAPLIGSGTSALSNGNNISESLASIAGEAARRPSAIHPMVVKPETAPGLTRRNAVRRPTMQPPLPKTDEAVGAAGTNATTEGVAVTGPGLKRRNAVRRSKRQSPLSKIDEACCTAGTTTTVNRITSTSHSQSTRMNGESRFYEHVVSRPESVRSDCSVETGRINHTFITSKLKGGFKKLLRR